MPDDDDDDSQDQTLSYGVAILLYTDPSTSPFTS
jgi:hypothetical protein